MPIQIRTQSLLRIGLVANTLLLATCGTKDNPGNKDAGPRVGDAVAAQAQNCLEDCGPTSDDYFSERKIAELRITVAQADVKRAAAEAKASGYSQPLDTWLDVLWGKWQHCGPYENYIPVQVEYRSLDGVGNVTMQNVGMRLRGTKSKGSNWLQGFKLDVQALLPEPGTPGAGAKKRKFAHMQKINALSIEGDKSLLLQCAAYKLMRKAGVPAPRCNHISVYVNDVYYGLMENVEAGDTGLFLGNEFDDNNGSLYSCSGGCGYDDSLATLDYLGDTFDKYRPPASKLKYEILQGEDKTPEVDLLPMLKCGSADATPNDDAYKACIQEWLDVPEWLRVIAAESLTPTLESFLGSYRNFYLYFTPDKKAPHGGRFSVYSWDLDTAFHKQACQPKSCDPFVSVAGWYIPPGVRSKFVLRLQRVFHKELCQAMDDFLKKAYLPELVDGLAAAVGSVINNPRLVSETWPVRVPAICPADASAGDACGGRVPMQAAEWQAAVTELREFIINNKIKMTAMVAASCSASVGPSDGGSADAPGLTGDAHPSADSLSAEAFPSGGDTSADAPVSSAPDAPSETGAVSDSATP